jgi:hypothetical protein
MFGYDLFWQTSLFSGTNINSTYTGPFSYCAKIVVLFSYLLPVSRAAREAVKPFDTNEVRQDATI